MIHFAIVIVFIVIILFFQGSSYFDTKKKIKRYTGLFPKDISSYSLKELCIKQEAKNFNEGDEDLLVDTDYPEDEEMEISVPQVHINNASATLLEVEHSLNMYLQKNKGAASDFHIMKDVVERYCDADEEEITTQQPIPLYLGLMGTMIGIIVGVIYIAATKGFSGDNITQSVTELMTCVAIAMSASLVGVYCTTRISWSSKNAFSKVEADKNRFYSWLQTELLPTLSGNTVNALYLLQQNLTTFNTTFQSNISGLNRALGQIKDTSSEQVELINLLQDIDIKRVAQANVTVLRELKDCTGELSRFNQYIHSVSDYLTAVNNLNTNINEHLNRTAAIERMGAFFEQEINQVTAREKYINDVVANVDDTLRKTFEKLSESTNSGVTALRNNSVQEFDKVSQTMADQQEAFRSSLSTQREEFAQTLQNEQSLFIDYLKGQKDTLAAKSEEISQIVSEIRGLSETKSAMGNLISETKAQNNKLDELIRLMGRKGHDGDGGVTTFEIPPFYKISVGAIAGLLLLGVGVSTVSLVSNLKSKDDTSTQMIQNIDEKVQSMSTTIENLQKLIDAPSEEPDNKETDK